MSAAKATTAPLPAAHGDTATKFDIKFFATCVRLLSIATNIGLMVVSVFGFQTGADMSGEAGEVEGYSFAEIGLFLSAMSIYFFAFATAAVLAEARMSCSKKWLARYFGFLRTFIGRGLFYIFLGSLLVLIGHTLSQVLGGTLLFCGVCQCFFTCVPSLKSDSSRDAAGKAAGASKGAGKGAAPPANADPEDLDSADVFVQVAKEHDEATGRTPAPAPSDVGNGGSNSRSGGMPANPRNSSDVAMDMFGGAGAGGATSKVGDFQRAPSL